jgi:hypothetical protein
MTKPAIASSTSNSEEKVINQDVIDGQGSSHLRQLESPPYRYLFLYLFQILSNRVVSFWIGWRGWLYHTFYQCCQYCSVLSVRPVDNHVHHCVVFRGKKKKGRPKINQWLETSTKSPEIARFTLADQIIASLISMPPLLHHGRPSLATFHKFCFSAVV